MTNEQLQKIVEQISLKYFQKPFCHQAYFNLRLKTTGGRYILRTHHIELNKTSYEMFGLEELIGIIKHELCHYHLHIEGKGYRHKDRDFKMLLNRTSAPRYCSSIKATKEKEQYKYCYECVKCTQKYWRKRKINIDKYCCSKCSGSLVKKL